MSNILRKYGPLAVGAVFLAAGALNAESAVSAADTNADGTVKQVRSEALPNVLGKSLTTGLVTYPNAPARPQILRKIRALFGRRDHRGTRLAAPLRPETTDF